MALLYLLFLSFLLALLPLFLVLLRQMRNLNPNPNNKSPPSPPRLPVIGNLHQMGSLPHRSLRSLSDSHGPLILLYLGRIPTLLVSTAAAAREIMRDHDAVFASRPQSKVTQSLFFGTDDLVFAPYGAYWRHARKLCATRLFSTKMVQSFSLMREQEVALMIDKISATTIIVDMSDVLYSFANDVLCRAVSGKFAGEGRKELFRKLIEENSELLGAFHFGDYFPSMGWVDDLFFGLSARAERNAGRWSVLLDEVIDNHAADHRRRGRSEDFVDVLLSLQEEEDKSMDFQLTKENVKALLVDMFAAGTDSSYIVLEWAMVELVRNREAMKILQDEVRGIVRGKDKVREEDLSEMRYLKGVLKEVLRLHPPAPLLVPRESMADCKLQDYTIPNKTRVVVNAWAISRDPEFWEAPEEFRPERFVNSSVDFKGNDFQFIPFGAGRRICPGMNFATTTTEFALANLVYHFDWALPDGMTRENLDMTEAPGITVRRKQKLELVAKSYYNL